MTMTREAPPAGTSPGAAPDRRTTPPLAPALSPDVRRTLLALLASMLGVFPLCELFLDRGWLIDVWLTMLVVVAPAAWLRRTSPPSAAQVWVGVVALVPWLTVNFVRDNAFLGVVPLRGAWHDIGALLTDLHTTTTNEVAPVHTTVAIRLAVCALLGLTAALVDLLAVVGRRGALAGVPLLIVFTVSGAVPRHPVSWLWFGLAASGFLVLLALDSSDDLHRWGHYVSRSRKTDRRRLGNYSGQRIGVAAILLAIVLPLAIPADSRNLIANWFHNAPPSSDDFGADDFGRGGSGTNGIDPFVTLRGQLIRNNEVDLLSVKVKGDSIGGKNDIQPFYLRTNVLSTFTGSGWRAGPTGATEPIADTQFVSSPGTAISPKTIRYRAEIDVTGLRSVPPLFGSPTAVDGLDSGTRWSPQNMLALGSKTTKGQTIQEDVAQPAPSLADLRAATKADPAMAAWTKLVPVSPFVTSTTAAVTRGAATPYAKARAITQYFANPANNFQYSLSTAAGDTGDDLADFLRGKVGFCQQYAAAMAVMLRLSGVPSRVVLGYAHDVPNADGQFKVTSYDAHAWVEAYFDGIGWIPFDPTPISGISGGAANDLPWAPHGSGSNAPTGGVTSQGSTELPTRATRPQQGPGTSSATPPTSGGSLMPLIVVAAIVIVAAIIALIPAAVRWRRRRHRLRLARAGDMAALWAELADSAVDLGYAWSDARTPRQVAAWLGGTRDDPTGSIRAIADAVERARYAPADTSGTQARPDLTSSLRSVIDGLRARRSSRERAQAVFWPASLGWARTPLLGRLLGRVLPGGLGLRRH